jgi:hypothetical protein
LRDVPLRDSIRDNPDVVAGWKQGQKAIGK